VIDSGAALFYRLEKLGEPVDFTAPPLPMPAPQADGVLALDADLEPGAYALRWYRAEDGPCVSLTHFRVEPQQTALTLVMSQR